MRTIAGIVGGILSAALILLAAAMLCRSLVAAIDALIPDPPRTVAITRADFPLCISVKPGPIMPRRPQSQFQRKKDNA